jgi:hypothetical protein
MNYILQYSVVGTIILTAEEIENVASSTESQTKLELHHGSKYHSANVTRINRKAMLSLTNYTYAHKRNHTVTRFSHGAH